ncbi:DUF7576 family protein [Haloarcula sp. GH36]|uniref:DUF7576 family protein n=1 Tax=Haloarcula montana TaxID=3111776 RepID=UPI002D76607A|nr:hypothetical protein [Haloarcula sp. GH36]
MVDPTSDHHEDIDEDEAPNCATCGDPIANETTHRVLTWIEEGAVQTAHFCDEQCRSDWDGE